MASSSSAGQVQKIRVGPAVSGLVVLIACAPGAKSGGPERPLQVAIVTPADQSSFLSNETTPLQAVASSAVAIKTLSVYAGNPGNPTAQLLETCAGVESETVLSCDYTLAFSTTVGVVSNGALQLTAQAFDENGNTASVEISVGLTTCAIQFVTPVATSASPPVAEVSGTSTVHLFASCGPLSQITVESDNPTKSVYRNVSPGDATDFTQDVVWATTVGAGAHVLTASATNKDGMVVSTTLAVQVTCTSDGGCSQ